MSHTQNRPGGVTGAASTVIATTTMSVPSEAGHAETLSIAGDLRYAGAAPIYWRAGWAGVLPLPYRSKRPVPAGWTGHGRPYPNESAVQAWCRTRGRGNLALRVPLGVLGIDVDVYHGGGEAMARLVERCGGLPPTWVSTSRVDFSGIRFFRVPERVQWREQRAGAGVELIQAEHRYAVVWPSAHPEGRSYRWYAPGGEPASRVPRVDELPELPESWVEQLHEREPAAGHSGTHPGGGGAGAVMAGAGYARSALAGAVAELREMRPGSGRNDALNRKAFALGGLVPDGLLDAETIRAELLAAAHANGLVEHTSERKALATIESGLRRGQLAPRRVGAKSRGVRP